MLWDKPGELDRGSSSPSTDRSKVSCSSLIGVDGPGDSSRSRRQYDSILLRDRALYSCAEDAGCAVAFRDARSDNRPQRSEQRDGSESHGLDRTGSGGLFCSNSFSPNSQQF